MISHCSFDDNIYFDVNGQAFTPAFVHIGILKIDAYIYYLENGRLRVEFGEDVHFVYDYYQSVIAIELLEIFDEWNKLKKEKAEFCKKMEYKLKNTHIL